MSRRFEDLYSSAATDGAFAPVFHEIDRVGSTDENSELLTAWFHERTQKIEGSLLLDETRRFLLQLLEEGKMSVKRRKRAEQLVRMIRVLRDSETDPTLD